MVEQKDIELVIPHEHIKVTFTCERIITEN